MEDESEKGKPQPNDYQTPKILASNFQTTYNNYVAAVPTSDTYSSLLHPSCSTPALPTTAGGSLCTGVRYAGLPTADTQQACSGVVWRYVVWWGRILPILYRRIELRQPMVQCYIVVIVDIVVFVILLLCFHNLWQPRGWCTYRINLAFITRKIRALSLALSENKKHMADKFQ